MQEARAALEKGDYLDVPARGQGRNRFSASGLGPKSTPPPPPPRAAVAESLSTFSSNPTARSVVRRNCQRPSGLKTRCTSRSAWTTARRQRPEPLPFAQHFGPPGQVTRFRASTRPAAFLPARRLPRRERPRRTPPRQSATHTIRCPTTRWDRSHVPRSGCADASGDSTLHELDVRPLGKPLVVLQRRAQPVEPLVVGQRSEHDQLRVADIQHDRVERFAARRNPASGAGRSAAPWPRGTIAGCRHARDASAA